MRLGDLAHGGEPKPGAVRSIRSEGLEEMVAHPGSHAGPVIANEENEIAAAHLGVQLYLRTGGRGFDRVRQQVGDRDTQLSGIDGREDVRRPDVDRDRLRFRLLADGFRTRAKQIDDIRPLRPRRRAFRAADDQDTKVSSRSTSEMMAASALP